jgi:biotin carboxyl carrier protein
MQSHDPDHSENKAPLNEMPSHGKFPDEVSRADSDSVSTSFAPGTGRRTKRAVGFAAAFLFVCFVAVILLRYFHAHAVATAGEAAYSAPPPVDVVIAKPATTGQDLVLPGETAAWFETTIYARVNGYVAKWQADIGDHVSKGQILATIETPDLDAELQAARAQLASSQAQVGARRAEAEFSNANPKRQTTKAPRHGCLRRMRRSTWRSPRWINTARWPSSNW